MKYRACSALHFVTNEFRIQKLSIVCHLLFAGNNTSKDGYFLSES